MLQSRLNLAVSRATGEKCALIDERGFSLVINDHLFPEDDLLDVLVDAWLMLKEGQAKATSPREMNYFSQLRSFRPRHSSGRAGTRSSRIR